MDPTGAQPPAGYPVADRGPRTPDRMAAWHGSPAAEPWSAPEPRPEPRPEAPSEPWPAREPPGAAAPPGRRTARRDRVSPQAVFAELLQLAGIPQSAYAVGEEVPGAMCVVKAEGGFEVFSCTDDARLEVHFFEHEEAAYFYLFGVLAAEAVRSGRLGPNRPNGYVNGSRGPGPAGAAATARENVSKYLRSRKLPKSPSRAVMVN